MIGQLSFAVLVVLGVLLLGIIAIVVRMYQKAVQGEAMVRTGLGDTKVSFSGIFVIPVLHKLEVMDITLKNMVIARAGSEGLVCKDNLRADVKVNFFVRVNKTHDDVVQVAQSIGCRRASDPTALENLFDAKFSEALKTVGKQFDFIELYNSREQFKQEILRIIGTDLNGYVLDDCAIDYLEQTPLNALNQDNILDAEGIKKIVALTSEQKIQANSIAREMQKTIKKQDVEAQETILQLDKQLIENQEKQKREIANIKARELAETEKVMQEERLKSEKARIATEEEVGIAQQNRDRQVLVAERNKQRTDAVETERVAQAKALEANERERIVALAQIEKEKALEEEKKNIQTIIRERIVVEKATVQEEEKIKDTRAQAQADREKLVAITAAKQQAEAATVALVGNADMERQAAEFRAKQALIDAEAEKASAEFKGQAIRTLAEAEASKATAVGLAEAQVMQAKATARQKEGETEANVLQLTAAAEAQAIQAKAGAQAEADEKLGLVAAKINREKGLADADIIQARADADQKKGLAEAAVSEQKFAVEAKGIEAKADAMKKLDGVGKDHEEFKLRLDKDKSVELAQINIQKDIAASQAEVIGEALKAAKIDIVGGETMFFDQIIGSITKGKMVDRTVHNSEVLGTVKDAFFSLDGGGDFKTNLRRFVDQFGFSAEEMKNLSVSALLLKMMHKAGDDTTRNTITELASTATALGIGDKPARMLELK
ncbi:flotillin family protein [Hymenobacter cellulosilyticus]|uniref:Flotillin family protein n=1 Tax=Hymenobacter cellulosilyticus TaxID=2932248 RepID=A0A8T9Q1T8_9BACT|nr:flotillin family protein [Hymenobacter cellulosilyticus]UOQ71454.1 flotillin family protein [Hymenobacter cellulosilyticus]